jgi:hypothetical protein
VLFRRLRCWLFGHRLTRRDWVRRRGCYVCAALCLRCLRVVETGESFKG